MTIVDLQKVQKQLFFFLLVSQLTLSLPPLVPPPHTEILLLWAPIYLAKESHKTNPTKATDYLETKQTYKIRNNLKQYMYQIKPHPHLLPRAQPP